MMQLLKLMINNKLSPKVRHQLRKHQQKKLQLPRQLLKLLILLLKPQLPKHQLLMLQQMHLQKPLLVLPQLPQLPMIKQLSIKLLKVLTQTLLKEPKLNSPRSKLIWKPI